MNPIKQGLIMYNDLGLPMSHASYGGSFVPTGSTPVYKKSTIIRNKRPVGRPKKNKQNENPEGGINFEDVKKTTKKVAKVVRKTIEPYAPEILDKAFDLGAKALAVPLEEVIGPVAPVVTNIASKAARNYVKKKTGYGKPSKVTRPAPVRKPRKTKMVESSEVGIYDGGLQKSKAKPKKSVGGVDKRKMRGALIKKLMKEKKLSLASASKYIKENNLM